MAQLLDEKLSSVLIENWFILENRSSCGSGATRLTMSQKQAYAKRLWQVASSSLSCERMGLGMLGVPFGWQWAK